MSNVEDRETASAEEKSQAAKRNAKAMASLARAKERRERTGMLIGMAAGGFGESASQGWLAKIIKAIPYAFGMLLLLIAFYIFVLSLAG